MSDSQHILKPTYIYTVIADCSLDDLSVEWYLNYALENMLTLHTCADEINKRHIYEVYQVHVKHQSILQQIETLLRKTATSEEYLS